VAEVNWKALYATVNTRCKRSYCFGGAPLYFLGAGKQLPLCWSDRVPLRVKCFHVAEQRSLLLDVRAISGNHNLRVRRIEVLPRG